MGASVVLGQKSQETRAHLWQIQKLESEFPGEHDPCWPDWTLNKKKCVYMTWVHGKRWEDVAIMRACPIWWQLMHKYFLRCPNSVLGKELLMSTTMWMNLKVHTVWLHLHNVLENVDQFIVTANRSDYGRPRRGCPRKLGGGRRYSCLMWQWHLGCIHTWCLSNRLFE